MTLEARSSSNPPAGRISQRDWEVIRSLHHISSALLARLLIQRLFRRQNGSAFARHSAYRKEELAESGQLLVLRIPIKHNLERLNYGA
jgi:hypothetical protein